MRIHRGGPGEGRRQVIKLPGGKTGKMGSTWWPGDNEDCGDGDGEDCDDEDGDGGDCAALGSLCCWVRWARRAAGCAGLAGFAALGRLGPSCFAAAAAAGWLLLLLAAAESGLCQDSLYQTPNAFGSTF